MESEQHHYELRSRSRSRSHTPMIPNRPLPEQDERHYDLRNWSRERSHTPGEVTSSRRSASRSTVSMKTHEKTMEPIEESKEGSVTESLTDNQSTKSESSVVVTKKAERRSERQRAKRQIFANGQSESKDDVSDQKAERKRKSVTPRRVLTSDYSSEEGEREDPLSRSASSAYEIYKQAGDWWNVFPKTDYTYSPASECRYEIAPGILAMPNMSRRSIHVNDNGSTVISRRNVSQASRGTTESGISDSDTIDLKETASLINSSENNYGMSSTRMSDSKGKATLYKKTRVEQYTSHKETIYSEPRHSSDFRSRYLSYMPSFREYDSSRVDSDTELDETFAKSTVKTKQNWKIVQWFTYFVTFIVAYFRKTVQFFRMDRKRQYYGAQAYRGSNVSKLNTLWQTLDRYTHNMYFFFVRMLVFDAWLLSQFTGVRKWLQEKGPRILWITLLPLLLLLGGWCIAQYLSLVSDVETAPQRVIERSLSDVQWEDRKSVIEELLANNEIIKDLVNKADLVNRIEMLENKQAHQMEYLMNISRTLEDRKKSDADFRKEYDDKIIDVENKLDVSSELKNMAYSELKVIKHEFEELRKLYSELKSCCNANAEFVANQNIEKRVEKILFGYFPSGISKEDLVKNMQTLFTFHNKEDENILSGDDANDHVSDEHIRKIVKEVLRIYDADKTGQVDYALETAGGQIISTRCTQRYDIKTRAYSLFGFPLYYESNDPRTVIQGNPIQPGVCWAFQDFPGYLLIQLRGIIYVTGFTLEHVPRLILPNENMSSAPRKFNVWGLLSENDQEPVMFGEYEFTISDENLQYFPVQNTEIKKPYEYIELRIHSNHGQLEYTCLYRFRVHGRPA
ncbi:uncharacterized protein LOC105200352 isoform X2 [Solenopsis invicta]|nr:uncharacterized protein LOC105200352 isoform X2 [Solenopsis invicta]XP_011166148.1 uncharacterized protein LOC105200352 isoform X2 [Solenopsis invicta]XP_011166149.1 uncharacterized protein LOC105200352 isoform X2 [Solenopsis invicta]XP_039304121.1 uncharacterized protein LOC105200352 isoform X2 [Solenopsis invicta]XP_039304122.1 uncharacterized protein LOC105200352 isoform X2 [Solenopsis invicta]